MRHLAAYLLLQIGGKAEPTAGDIKKLLSTVGIEADDDRLTTLISELEGKSINDVCCLLFPSWRFYDVCLLADCGGFFQTGICALGRRWRDCCCTHCWRCTRCRGSGGEEGGESRGEGRLFDIPC